MPRRNFFRWFALVGGLAILLWRAPHALRDYRDWRAVIDPSAAELYETELWFETAGVAVALGLGLLVFFSLRRKPIGEPSGKLCDDFSNFLDDVAWSARIVVL